MIETDRLPLIFCHDVLMRWAYTIYRSDEDLDTIQQALEGFGQEGWEMVSMAVQQFVDEQNAPYDQFTFFFKRPA